MMTTYETACRVIDEAGQAGGIDEVRRIADRGWPGTVRVYGREACQAHVDCGVQLYSFATDVDDGGPVTLEQAVQIRTEDPGLVYADVRDADILEAIQDRARAIVAEVDEVKS